MKQIYLGETIQLIVVNEGVEIANKLVQSGEIRFLTKGDVKYPYLVIETSSDNQYKTNSAKADDANTNIR